MLPPAPLIDGMPCSPRQVRAGVPANIDAVTCEALFGRPRRGEPTLTTPALLADALAQAAPHAPLTPPPPPPSPDWPDRTAALPQGSYPYSTQYGDQYGQTGTGLRPAPGTAPHRMPPGRRPAAGRAAAAVVILLVIAAIGVGAWSLGRNLGSSPSHPRSTHGQPAPAAATTVLKPLSAHGFDVYDTTGEDHNENDSLAPRAIDGDPGTAWHTLHYTNPRFGNLKPGTGLILDMGKAVRLTSMEVKFGQATGADVSIKVGNQNTPFSPSTLGSFATVAHASGIGGTYTFTMTSHASGRYVLIWFTKLPPGGTGGQPEAEIDNIVLHGSS